VSIFGLLFIAILTESIVGELFENIIENHPPPPQESTLPVKGFVDDPAGLVIYLPIEEVQEMISMTNMTTGIFIEVNDNYNINIVKNKVYREFEVLYIEATEETILDWKNMLQLYTGFISVISVFGVIISSTIIYNTMTINVRERIKEYATMRTMGIRIREVINILSLEHLIMILLGSLVGIPISIYASKYFLGLYNSDFFSFDAVIYPVSYLFALFVLLLVLLLTLGSAYLTIKKIDLPRIIKESSL
jgi:ABC-type antimicrobial peptide transport system permease subunit